MTPIYAQTLPSSKQGSQPLLPGVGARSGVGLGRSRFGVGVQHPADAQALGGQGEVGASGEGERVPELGVQAEQLPDRPGETISSGPAFFFFLKLKCLNKMA